MTGPVAARGPRTGTDGGRIVRHGWRETFLRRVRERDFWLIQAGVVTVTGIHVAVEAFEVMGDHEGPTMILARLPVVLYVLPVLYAGFRYGTEGGLLTGAWTVLLTVPNLFVWHGTAYEWMGEALFMLVVVGIGVAVAVPVEREQREHARAEEARHRATRLSRRLALLSDVASMLVHTIDPDDALDWALRRLLEAMDLRAVAVATWAEDRTPTIVAWQSVGHQSREGLSAAISTSGPDALSTAPVWLAPKVVAFVLPTEDAARSALLVSPGDDHGLPADELELLDAVAHHLGVAFDNARLHRLEKQRLRWHLQGVTRAQEDERRRIARDLHDVATHELLLVRRDLEELGGDGVTLASRVTVARARERIVAVIDQLRRFSRELRPSVLDHLGLAPALEWLTDEKQLECGCTTLFELEGTPWRLPPETELALYRIAEEALRNVERHAAADRATVRLTFASDAVRLTITDDGAGFRPASRSETVTRNGGLGLLNMRERAQLIGATLDVTACPGHGTVVFVEASVDRARTVG